jgi:hypothetical protein
LDAGFDARTFCLGEEKNILQKLQKINIKTSWNNKKKPTDFKHIKTSWNNKKKPTDFKHFLLTS